MTQFPTVTYEELKSFLKYDHETGIFRWKVKRYWINPGDEAGCRAPHGYIFIGLKRRRYTAHRLAIFYMTGEWPPQSVDHINGIRDDNRYSNLRLASNKQNSQNAGPRLTSKSGIKGVCYERRCPNKPWKAEIYMNGKNKFLGHFFTKEEAGAAYAAASIKLHGEFSRYGQSRTNAADGRDGTPISTSGSS